jgi:hypothetical protein
MKTTHQPLAFDGKSYGVLTYRVQYHTSDGTRWRFITEKETIVVVPCQTPATPASAPRCVPKCIVPVLCGLGLRRDTMASLFERIVKSDIASDEVKEKRSSLEEELRKSLVNHGVMNLSGDALTSIYECIRNLYPTLRPPGWDTPIKTGHMRAVLAEIGKVTGADITHAVIKSTTEDFAPSAARWTARVVRNQEMSQDEALQYLLQRVRYVGISLGRQDVLIDQAGKDLHDAEDWNLLCQVRGGGAIPQKSPVALAQQNSANLLPAKPPFNLGDYCSQQAIIRDVLGDSDDTWEINRAEVEKEVRTYTPPGMKRRLFHREDVRNWFEVRNKIPPKIRS